MSIKINKADLKRLQKDIADAIEDANDDTFKFYRKETPVRGGNARNKTKYRESRDKYSITSNYDYAERLDEGWSKQSPKGFTKPSFEFLKNKLNRNFKKI